MRLLFVSLIAVLTACNSSFEGRSYSSSSHSGEGQDVPILPTDSGGTTNACHIQLQAANTPIKVIFVVDTSGSNLILGQTLGTGGVVTTVPGSDPIKNLRGNSIKNFYKDYGDNLMFKWSFITFANLTATPLLQMGDKAAMGAAIDTFFTLPDSGLTPYAAALRAARDAIANDANPGADDKYVVIFISDGLPQPMVADDAINALIDGITALKPGAVTVNGIYYGQVNAAATARIRSMASRGGGKFLDLSGQGTDTFEIASAINVPGTACK